MRCGRKLEFGATKSRPNQLREVPVRIERYTERPATLSRSLVLVGAEVDTAALWASFAVDVGVDVGFQVTDDGGG